MKLALVTDAWRPQMNGVVRTLETVTTLLRERNGVDILIVSPDRFRSTPCPTYPEIRLAILPGRRMRQMLDHFAPDAIHIATEGPLGLAARSYCISRGLSFTTAYHTKFPEYVNLRTGLPLGWLYRLVRWFHKPATGVMVATQSIANELEAHGFDNIVPWSRGVDLDQFQPYAKDAVPALCGLKRPILMYVGRVAIEKNIRAFLDLKTDGSKVVVGDGPQLEALQRQYTDAVFVGRKVGEELARHYSAADVFVFPSTTDTFGLVILEALACGTPVAAYPASGPIDIIGPSGLGTLDGFSAPIGALHQDLGSAVEYALTASSEACRKYALHYSWDACAARFIDNLVRTTPAPHSSAASVREQTG